MAKANRRISTTKKKRDFSWFKKIMACLRLCVLVSLGLAVTGVIGFYGVKTTQQFLNRPIVDVVIKGDFNYITKETVAGLVKNMIGSSFVGENISQIKTQVQSMPWIDQVNLIRQWPDRLVVDVKEHTPIARWGDIGFVNIRGELIVTQDNSGLMHLSKLYGAEKEAPMIMQQYSKLANVFRSYDLAIRFLQKNHRGVWQLQLNNDWLVVLGRGDVLKKIQRLTQLLDRQLLTAETDVVMIDIRYTNGISVQWGLDSEQKYSMLGVDKKNIHTIVKLNDMQAIMHMGG